MKILVISIISFYHMNNNNYELRWNKIIQVKHSGNCNACESRSCKLNRECHTKIAMSKFPSSLTNDYERGPWFNGKASPLQTRWSGVQNAERTYPLADKIKPPETPPIKGALCALDPFCFRMKIYPTHSVENNKKRKHYTNEEICKTYKEAMLASTGGYK